MSNIDDAGNASLDMNKLNITTQQSDEAADNGGVKVTCFSQLCDDVTFHFQIIRLSKQIYAWIGCNSARLGHLYAAAPTRPNDAVCVACLIGGACDNVGSSLARRLGLNIVLACNIPKNSPALEATAEKILMQKLISLGYTKVKEGSSS